MYTLICSVKVLTLLPIATFPSIIEHFICPRPILVYGDTSLTCRCVTHYDGGSQILNIRLTGGVLNQSPGVYPSSF